MSKSCMICGTEESEGELLLEAPCGRHWVCPDDVGSFFENATNNESLFPPQCCGDMFMLEEYEDYVPFETAWAYQMKQQGEYSILAKFRVYCANPPCGKFLHPGLHVEDPEMKITYAICEAGDCGELTCVKCRTLLDKRTQNHECKQNEDDKKFKQTAKEKGYQECFVCGATVELAEACNHITCECGSSFCYICGENWPGPHGCPPYGPAVYDEEGYNQDGYHRDSGLNREGLTRRQETIRRREEENEEDEDDDEGENEDDEWEVLQHLTPDQRLMVNQLPHGPREDALDQFRITLFETQGITFDQFAPQPPPPLQEEFGDDDDVLEDDDGEELDNGQGENWGLAGGVPRPTPDQILPDEVAEELLAIADGVAQTGMTDGLEPEEDRVPVVHHSDDEDDVNTWRDYQDDYANIDGEGTQESILADGHSEGPNFDAVTLPIDRNGEETGQEQQVPANYEFTLTTSTHTDTHLQPGNIPTDGPHTIVARGFVSGTTIQDVEATMSRHSEYGILGRTLRASDPLIVELQFATKRDAENVIAAFHGQKADGRVLDVRMEDEDL